MGMKIHEFSERTGLSPSTLRFYDLKKLLEPQQRLENGYRIYTEEQVSHALMIHSLRLADINIEDIYHFMHSGTEEKERLISNWRREVDSKISSLKIVKQYLSGMSAKEQQINLVKWEKPITFIWFRHTVPRKMNPFQSVMKSELEKINKLGLDVRPGIFLRTLESKANTMVGEIGFILNKGYQSNLICDESYIEQQEPVLYATMECNVYDQFMCFNFIRLVNRFGFKTNGLKLEKFESPDDSTFSYLIPLLNPS
ncbi:MerR family transcriptional regulator [Paucisalibacillus globulus]|uniref:MerR family transcriptional regulator n=1 Tax=Paucisalibacillus globulus TaxID=351095 RepID=UPI0020D0A440|nr:MerR family transcriptional regulator [Paucisalibacillus globulus]